MEKEAVSFWPEQIEDLSRLIKQPRCGLFSDPATGKTPTAVLWSYYLWDKLKIKTVWVQPSSIIGKNQEEIIRFSPWTEDDVVIVSEGSRQQRLERMKQKDAKVFLFTATGFAKEWRDLLAYHPDVKALIGDEWHLLYSGYNSKRFEELMSFNRLAYSIVPMTGTLINGKLSHAYPAIHLLEPRMYGSLQGFENKHAILDENLKVAGWREHEHLKKVLEAVGIRRSFESVHGPEAKLILTEMCEMKGKQLEAYISLEENATAELEDTFLVADSSALEALRCRQIMAHPHTFKLLKEDELTGKEERILFHLERHLEADQPMLVFGTFQAELERMTELIGKRVGRDNVAMINGTVSQAKRVQIDEDFRAGKLKYIVGSSLTCAFGFNWHQLEDIYFMSRDYSDGTFLQAYRRGIRGKRKTPLRIHLLEYADSIDQRISLIIQARSEDANKVDGTRQVFHFSEGRPVATKKRVRKKDLAYEIPEIAPGEFSMAALIGK